VARRGWQTPLDDPLPGIRTLRDAADHIMKLPKAEQQTPHWQAAIEAVIMAAEGRGPLMHARIGLLRALKPARKYRIVR
jgi:hypothetical protein